MSDIREGYKETEIGIIPEEWDVKKLGDLSEYRRGSFPQPYGRPEWYDKDNGMPFVQVYDVAKNYKLKNQTKSKISDVAKDKSVFVPKGTLIITLQGTLGRAAITQYDAYIDRTLLIFTRINPSVVARYFMYSLEELFSVEKKKADGGVIKTITKKTLTEFKIPIPPLKEQDHIAEILSTTDSHIESLDRLIEDYELLKKGMMQKLLTEGIGHTEFKETEVGRIPKEWEEKKLGDIVKICYGKKQTSVESPTGKYKILGTGGIIGYANEFLYDKPSVLIGRKGTINKPMYIEEPFWTVDTLFYTDFISKTNEKWLYYVLNKIDLMKYNEATGVPSLNIKTLNSIRLSVPSYEEQHEIAVILSSIDVQIDQLKENKNYYINLKQALMDRLLTGKVRVV